LFFIGARARSGLFVMTARSRADEKQKEGARSVCRSINRQPLTGLDDRPAPASRNANPTLAFLDNKLHKIQVPSMKRTAANNFTPPHITSGQPYF
jgi:hypothetical protein